jgi:hypothetical protein
MKKVSDSEIVSDLAITSGAGGNKQTMQMTARQKYIGATCSKEAMSNRPK